MIHSWPDLLFCCVAGIYFFISSRMLWHSRWAKRLPPRTCFSSGVVLPPTHVSIVIAARDEANRIEITVRRLLAQREVPIEIIVVNDRSTDGTGELLTRLETEDPRVKAIHVKTLPAEWLGKCHACFVGANAATGEWILFTDADCWLPEDVLIRALHVARRETADHITLTPGIKPASIQAAAWHLSFLMSLLDWFAGVNRDHPNRFLGMGAFNLVRKTSYEVSGGYQALRLTVVDDVKLGLLLRRAGFRTRGFIGGDETLCDWGTTLRSIIRIMEKNYFAAVDYRAGAVGAILLFSIALWGSGLAGAFAGSSAGALATLGLLSLVIPAGVMSRRLRWSLAPAFLAPFMFPLLIYAIVNSTLVTLKQGGIRWRDTFYPLEMLRRKNVQ